MQQHAVPLLLLGTLANIQGREILPSQETGKLLKLIKPHCQGV